MARTNGRWVFRSETREALARLGLRGDALRRALEELGFGEDVGARFVRDEPIFGFLEAMR